MLSKILSSLFHYKLLEQNLVDVFGNLLVDYCPAKSYSFAKFLAIHVVVTTTYLPTLVFISVTWDTEVHTILCKPL